MIPLESQDYDRKSLRTVTGKTADWDELAKDAVAFAAARGGKLLIGIEDGQEFPPPGQILDRALPDKVRKRLRERTVNLELIPEIRVAPNGAEYLELLIPRSIAVPSTSDGRFFIRVGDNSVPVVGDEVLRLATDRSSVPWETLPSGVPRHRLDPEKLASLIARLRASERVKASVKAKTDEELLEHYLLVDGDQLTHLGVLCVGRRADRVRLGTAPVVQALKFDETGQRVNKWVWDEHELTPMELVDAVWHGIPEFQERYELREGLFPVSVPMFDEAVVRELLVNALVHRPYTQRGDIFLNFYPDRLEVVNPGRLPIGVTPGNILHKSVRRNDELARIFHDLNLMEREGSGFDLMYEILLGQGKPVPVPSEGADSVMVMVQRRILKPELIGLMTRADQAFQLSQKEKITLGTLALSDGLTAQELCARLELGAAEALKPWLGRLEGLRLVETTGRTKATRYFVPPKVLSTLEVEPHTTLVRIEPHRLRALILEDIKRYPDSGIGQIHARIGSEIPRTQVKRMIDELAIQGHLDATGLNRGRKYRIKP
ncbi:ATP-binding protein [Holophaga foetida]|uniref:ATP-binding protein n=1 Tax=Holophaga foetida TaxID=35839 RepID=UPI0002474667|nr:ATP-binding protein [Holophaga foetida]